MTLSHIQPGRSPFYKFTAFARTTRSWPCAFARSLLHDNVGYTLQLVAKQAAADEPFLERARLDRMQVPCVPILDPQPSWSVSSPLSARCFRQSVPAAGELGRLLRSLHPDTRLSEKVAQMLQDVCSRPLAHRVMPASCPPADGGVCHIICRGKRRGCKFLTATGMWLCEAATYSCKTHEGFRWNLPVGTSFAGATLVGDVMGDWIAHSSFWPPIWQSFLATESYVAIERHVRRQVFLACGGAPKRQQLATLRQG